MEKEQNGQLRMEQPDNSKRNEGQDNSIDYEKIREQKREQTVEFIRKMAKKYNLTEGEVLREMKRFLSLRKSKYQPKQTPPSRPEQPLTEGEQSSTESPFCPKT